MINFYHDTWGRHAHVLAPLTSLTKVDPKTFWRQWTMKHLKAFCAVKAMIANNVLLHYPNPNLPFDIETDASEYQLGGRILQEDKTVAFYTHKLTEAHRRYPTVDKEALSISGNAHRILPHSPWCTNLYSH